MSHWPILDHQFLFSRLVNFCAGQLKNPHRRRTFWPMTLFSGNVSHGISPLNVSLSSSESKYGSYYCSHIILLCYLLHTNSLKGTKEEGERGRRRWEVLSRKLFWSKGHKKGQRSTANGILTLLQRCVCVRMTACVKVLGCHCTLTPLLVRQWEMLAVWRGGGGRFVLKL